MAVTGFWPIYKNLKATLDYADNPDKTTAREYLDDDLYAALSYAENDNKTDRKMYVGGINCSKQNAYAEMIAVQRRFGIRGKVVGYHGIQSFREGEVTPEQAFEIGKATARKMWGDKFQVLVTVHLNTDNLHCHFVVNPVSFKDGTKFQTKSATTRNFAVYRMRYAGNTVYLFLKTAIFTAVIKKTIGGTSPARKHIGTISVRMWNIACLLLPLRENLIASYMRSDIRLTTYVFP